MPLTQCHILYINTKYVTTQSNAMSDEIVPLPPPRGAGGCSNRGSQAIRRGSRNKATLAAATLLDGEALGLTRTAIEAA